MSTICGVGIDVSARELTVSVASDIESGDAPKVQCASNISAYFCLRLGFLKSRESRVKVRFTKRFVTKSLPSPLA